LGKAVAHDVPAVFAMGDKLSIWQRLKVTLLWLLSTGLLTVLNHSYGNVLSDWASEGLSILLSIPRTRMSVVMLELALLGGAAAAINYFISRVVAKKDQ
jgi:hypothetical protein